LADHRLGSGGSFRPGAGNDNDDAKGQEDTYGDMIGSRKSVGEKDGQGKWMGAEEGKGKPKLQVKCITNQTPVGDSLQSPEKTTETKVNGTQETN
jgi:hypothetical protein